MTKDEQDNFIPVARRKLAALKSRLDFVKVMGSNEERVVLEFTHDQACIDCWGRVTWKSGDYV
tara:strand:- start:131 stop:319 length:189 start_codon:yes stop_codon:yes gene_type:complete